MKHIVSVALDNGRIATATADENGIYKIPLSWRYSLAEPGVVLDALLVAQGIVYVRRRPGDFHEEWKLAPTPEAVVIPRYNWRDDGSIPKDFVSPTF